MSLRTFEGFDILWFKPNEDNSLAHPVQLDAIYIATLPQTTAQFLSQCWESGRIGYGRAIKTPMNILYEIGSLGNGIILGVAFKCQNGATKNDTPILSLWTSLPTDGASPLLTLLPVISAGKWGLGLFRGGTWNRTTGLGSPVQVWAETPNRNFNEWVYIEWKITKGTNNLQSEIRVNGNVVATIADTGVPNPASYVDIWVSSNYHAQNSQGQYITNHAFDDFYFIVIDNTPPTNYLGNVYVWTSVPVNAVDTQWNATSQGHVNSVNEGYITPSPRDNQFVYTSSIGVKESWLYNFPVTDIYNVHAVKFHAVIASNTNEINLNEIVRIGNTEYTRSGYGSRSKIGDVWEGFFADIMVTRPDGRSWAPTDLNNIVIGVKTI